MALAQLNLSQGIPLQPRPNAKDKSTVSHSHPIWSIAIYYLLFFFFLELF
jgi:hypothetical protein